MAVVVDGQASTLYVILRNELDIGTGVRQCMHELAV
jgi:hypothetical protein